MRILVVEDTDDSRELFRYMLERRGHEVLEATNGRKAVEVALASHPDFVLMDLSMPEADGFQAIGALRAILPFNKVPIVAITAHSQPEWRTKALSAGCDGFLLKPVSDEDLYTTIDKLSSL